MNRKQRRAARAAGAKPTFGAAAATASAGALAELFAAAVARHQCGALADAERQFRHIITLSAVHAEAHGRLGSVLLAQGKTSEAILHLDRAIALKPDLFEAFGNLAQAHLWLGQGERAVEFAMRALELRETAQTKALFVQCLQSTRFTADNRGLRRLALRALAEAWARPRELGHACISLIKLNGAVQDCIELADSRWPARLSDIDPFGTSTMAALAREQLLCCLLECDPVTDIGLERLLTNVRYAMLRSATGDAPDDSLLAFYCSVARQCFVNEYVFSTTEAEAEQAQRLRVALERALAAGDPCPALWPVIVAAYAPLHTLPNAAALVGRAWPPCLDALITQQVTEPAQERAIAATIPVLTDLAGEVSRAVRQQYEESPYPRWVRTGPTEHSAAAAGHEPAQPVEVLIAGCGTGLSAIEFARQVRHARVLAIDLSRASLSYAKRMAQALRIANIEFAQADILKVGSIGRQFDFIDASGVLHHLADPWEGWRVLLSLLRPGGAMQVGLYSALARRNVVAARALIAERGYRPVAPDIRRCREEIAAAKDGSLLQSLTRMDDFYSTSECRDLLFHAQEHRLTLPDIKAFLAAQGLQFAGFVLPPATLQRFAARFPERSAMTNLDCWHAFETAVPDTFAAMYLFQVHKRTNAG
jgi:2-polyprenyl-3-methyl-5-hydroxy-6-metoxy-1,4-benzoquinol methylase